jgi:hypothetical protein
MRDEAPRAQRLGLNDNLMRPLPGAALKQHPDQTAPSFGGQPSSPHGD